jgi:hypothetical protein
MALVTVHSTQNDPVRAAKELHDGLNGLSPRFLLFFASSGFAPDALGAALRETFGAVPSIGCTTAGEIVSGKMLKGSIVMLAMDADELGAVAVACIDDLHDRARTIAAVDRLASAVGMPARDLDPGAYLGLVLQDGLSVAEEAVMEALSTATNVAFIGGSAGDDVEFRTTHVFVNSEPRTGAAVLALLKPKRPFHLLKTQSFDVLDQKLVVTSADEATRTVKEFNGKPAAEEYARAIGVPVEELTSRFQSNPVGLVLASGEPFVRSPQQLKGTDVVFYCQVKAGMQLQLLRSRNIVEDTQRDFTAKVREIGRCRAVINFHCILRTLELEQKNQCDAYGKIFADVPTVGFSTYGESYIGHINQTSTLVLFE